MKIPHACLRILLSLENALTNSKRVFDYRPRTSPNQRRLPRDWLLHACVFGEIATEVAILHLFAYCFEHSYALSPGLLSTCLCRLLAESSKKGLSNGGSVHPKNCYLKLYNWESFLPVRKMRSIPFWGAFEQRLGSLHTEGNKVRSARL